MSGIFVGLWVVCLLTVLIIASVLISRDRHSSERRWLALFLVASGLWSAVINLQDITMTVAYNTLVVRMTFVAAIVMSYSMLEFVLAVFKLSPNPVRMWLARAGALVALGLSVSSLVIPTVAITTTITPVRTPLYLFVLFVILSLALVAIFLARASHRPRNMTKHQHKLIVNGLILGLLIAVVTNIMLPNITQSITPARYAWVAPLVWSATLAYGIVRHHLFDVRLAVVRGLAYLLSLSTLAAGYAVVVVLVSSSILNMYLPLTVALVHAIVALGMVAFFQPVKKFFDKVTNRAFYRNNYSTNEFFAAFNKLLNETVDLHTLFQRISGIVAKTMHASQVFFVVHHEGGHISTGGTHGHRKIAPKDAKWLDEFVIRESADIIYSKELGRSDDERVLKHLMISYRIDLIVPLIRAGQVAGYLCLGERCSGGGYYHKDIRVLTTIADELVIAIQNALAVQEIKAINATLQQRIDEATKELRHSNAQLRRLDEAKDEFVSMASHQLRTPLTSVKGYLDMVLEGDAGDITPTQRKLLGEAFDSSERMVHLISDFLSVSRLQTGKFIIEKRPTDLIKLVTQEIDSLKVSAAQRELAFSFKKPKRPLPLLNIDEAKFRQVIMNFADNAIYYSRPGTTIHVELSFNGKIVVLRVKDTGIGVPEAEQAHLFTKFFRATNARKHRPDGTGVGLYLAKRVVTSHGGEIVFQSSEGKGSVFGFSLPVQGLLSGDGADKLKD